MLDFSSFHAQDMVQEMSHFPPVWLSITLWNVLDLFGISSIIMTVLFPSISVIMSVEECTSHVELHRNPRMCFVTWTALQGQGRIRLKSMKDSVAFLASVSSQPLLSCLHVPGWFFTRSWGGTLWLIDDGCQQYAELHLHKKSSFRAVLAPDSFSL